MRLKHMSAGASENKRRAKILKKKKKKKKKNESKRNIKEKNCERGKPGREERNLCLCEYFPHSVS